jgi:hypothetical protein
LPGYDHYPKSVKQTGLALQSEYDMVMGVLYDVAYRVLGAFYEEAYTWSSMDDDASFAAGEIPPPSGNVPIDEAISPETKQRLSRDWKQGCELIMTKGICDELLKLGGEQPIGGVPLGAPGQDQGAN